MALKHHALDVVKMYSTLTLEHWESCLRKAIKARNIDKLVAWRYGLQAGLADAAKKGISTPEMDIWVIKRCRDLEKCARFVLRKKHKNPMDDPKADRQGYVAKALEAKRKRDRDFERFLQLSSY